MHNETEERLLHGDDVLMLCLIALAVLKGKKNCMLVKDHSPCRDDAASCETMGSKPQNPLRAIMPWSLERKRQENRTVHR